MNPRIFAFLCYCVLMQNGNGIMDKSEDYIAEKIDILDRGYQAFAALDIHNMRVVVEWFAHRHEELPVIVLHEWERQLAAAKEFGDSPF